MAVGRQLNLQGQWRLDVAHLRSIESAVAYDFDVLAGAILGGKTGYIVNGFTLYNSAGGTLIGATKGNLRLATAGGTVIHYNGSYNGSVLMVPSGRAAESPALTSNVKNYIGLNYVRAPDASTADIVQFLNTSVNPPVEVAVSTPLAQTLDYTLVITQHPNNFASPAQGVTSVPIAIVEVDVGNNIVSVQDARRMYLRLNQGGDSAGSPAAAYTWGSRTVEDLAAFTGGDKDFGHERNWKTGIMTRIWEIAGGLQWYSDTTDRNTKLAYGPFGKVYDAGTAYSLGDIVTYSGVTYYCIQAGTGHQPDISGAWWTAAVGSFADNFDFNGTQVRWDGLTISFATNTDAGTAAKYNIIVSQATYQAIADGGALYVDVNRATDGARVTPAIAASVSALGTPTIPGSRYVLAWRRDTLGVAYLYTRDRAYEVGRNYTIASTSVTGVVRTATTSYAPTTPFAIMAASAANKAAATGMTRTTISAGTIAIGGEANDTLITLTAGTGVTAEATSGNNVGILGTAFGSGATVAGVKGLGSAGGAQGVYGEGTITSTGVYGKGGPNNGYGVHGVGGGGDAFGVVGWGYGAYAGVLGAGGGADGGAGTGYGVEGRVGAAGSVAVYGDGTTATTNGTGIKGVGKGTGYGVYGTSSGSGPAVKGVSTNPSNGVGVNGVASAGNGHGVWGTGFGTGNGVYAESGSGNDAVGVFAIGGLGTNSHGVRAYSGSGAGSCGVHGVGYATGRTGVKGTGNNAPGVEGEGGGTGTGVSGIGGPSAGSRGVAGQGGLGGGTGVEGEATGAYYGVHGSGGLTGVGGYFVGNATRAALRLNGVAYGAGAGPASPSLGDIIYNSSDGHFYGRTNVSGTPAWTQLDN